MGKVILSINAGSSSVKVSVFAYDSNNGTASPSAQQPHELAIIQIAGLTAPPATLTYDCGDEHIADQQLPNFSTQQDAFSHILKHLTDDRGLHQLQYPDADIAFACHRVVHGGDYATPIRIDKETYAHLEALSDLAPLHNAGALTIVRAVHDQLPQVPNIAFFDSAFHHSLPAAAYTYAIDPQIAAKNKLRKYGFHGLSYAYITRAVAFHLRKPVNETNIIALHLGSGASACCIRRGRSVDTSMGLTPLAGLPGATRSGDVDPSLIFHFTHSAGKLSPSSSKALHITQAEEILNKKSGWAALAGTTDFGVISAKAADGHQGCGLAFDVFVDRIVGFVAGYFVKLGGEVDGLVFAGGIGEKGVWLREAVVGRLACLGFELDAERNEKVGEGTVESVGREGARYRVLVCKTDEQGEMARQCVEDAERLGRR